MSKHFIPLSAFTCSIASASLRKRFNPLGESIDDVLEEGTAIIVVKFALLVEQLKASTDIGFRLLQNRHIKEDERLAQVMVSAEATNPAR